MMFVDLPQKNLLRRVFLSAKSVKTDQWTDTTVTAPVCDYCCAIKAVK